MSLFYTLYVATERSLDDVLQTIVTYAENDTIIENREASASVLRADNDFFEIYVSKTSSLKRDILEESLNISPDVNIRFDMYSIDTEVDAEIDHHHQKRKAAFLQTAIKWLEHQQGDAALLFNGEIVIFLRKDGQLILNSAIDFWKPYYLNMLSLPYESNSFPVI